MGSLTWKDVKVKVITKEYEKGVTYSKSEMEQYEGVNIIRDEQLSKWSIRIIPNS